MIESCLSTVRHVARNVRRWQGGDSHRPLDRRRVLEAQKVKGYRELEALRNN